LVFDTAMQRLLFSDNSEVGPLPVFELIEDAPAANKIHVQVSTSPKMKQAEAECRAGDASRASITVENLI